MNYYLFKTVKSFHIISVISWMAGMLYLPRIYSYHVKYDFSEIRSVFAIMERRLLYIILLPATVIAVCSGLVMGYATDAFYAIWFHIKMLFVFLMLVMTCFMVHFQRKFANNVNSHSALFYKIINELITLCMMIIVFVVVIKPFR
ncbi:MAG: putative integral membrane protein [Candidatus Xenolissoclinum pacificiensis L6]|uniref:Protoporphyrinogen IX oxidase n=1 Tax=Candidatus Xenolissoclinum pacificiensis L6 TaxID=1401685 RepID=W2V2T7_9RICK|nr:MAG: putative integral membrane protein [Candidatus Xenolissoclinum pacificiensis L6]